MSPNFTALLLTGIAFSVVVLGFMAWRFGVANMMVFVVVAGLFPAVMDFLSSFVARNYEYPGNPNSGCSLTFFWLDGDVRDMRVLG